LEEKQFPCLSLSNPDASNAGIDPATKTELCGPQISAFIRTFSAVIFLVFFVQKITCKALKMFMNHPQKKLPENSGSFFQLQNT